MKTHIRQVMLLSSSAPHGYGYLEYARHDIETLLKKNDVKEILFVPYALRDYEKYTEKIRKPLEEWGFKVSSVHEHPNAVEAVNSAEAIFIGGGNTFQLLKSLYENDIVQPIRRRVLEDGIPYIGSSAGTNVATVNICTTNDMPIVYPPTFDALNLIPFNINPHYLDPIPDSTHQGETREERILQYQEIPDTGLVLGLREGATLMINGNNVTLAGVTGAKLFSKGKEPKEYDVGADLSFLLEQNKED